MIWTAVSKDNRRCGRIKFRWTLNRYESVTGWLTGWLASWLAGWLAGWLANRLADGGSFLSLVLANIKIFEDEHQHIEY